MTLTDFKRLIGYAVLFALMDFIAAYFVPGWRFKADSDFMIAALITVLSAIRETNPARDLGER